MTSSNCKRFDTKCCQILSSNFSSFIKRNSFETLHCTVLAQQKVKAVILFKFNHIAKNLKENVETSSPEWK